MGQLLHKARELQLMADDKEEHRQSLRRILSVCDEHHHSIQDQIYLREKNEEVKEFKQNLTTSLHLLNGAQEGISTSQTDENIRVTGLDYKSQNSINSAKNIMNRLSEQSRKTYFKSLPQNKSSTQRSELLSVGHRKTESKKKETHDRLSLPILMNKMRMTKQPANASKNSSLDLAENKKKIVEENLTYDHIRSQRRKIEELRHLTVLGKVMGQNYKRHLKKLQQRKKLFLRTKLHSDY